MTRVQRDPRIEVFAPGDVPVTVFCARGRFIDFGSARAVPGQKRRSDV